MKKADQGFHFLDIEITSSMVLDVPMESNIQFNQAYISPVMLVFCNII